MTSMWGTVATATMDPAERAGYLFSFFLFLIGGILLLVFGIRRLNRRSRLLREQEARAAQQAWQAQHQAWQGQQQAWSGQPGPGEQSPYASPQPGGPGEHPAYPPPQETTVDAFGTERRAHDPARPPGRAGSVIMIVIGALLLLGVLGNLANVASGST